METLGSYTYSYTSNNITITNNHNISRVPVCNLAVSWTNNEGKRRE